VADPKRKKLLDVGVLRGSLDPTRGITSMTIAIAACAVCGEDKPDAFRIYFDGYLKLYRCCSCSHVAQFPGPGGNMVIDNYDFTFGLGFVEKGWEFQYPYRQNGLTDIAKRALKVAGVGKRLLDVGGGDGHFIHCAEGLGFDCTGVEPSELLSEYAASKVRGRIVRGYYEKSLFPKESFDVITFIQVVEHLLDPLDVLKTAHYHLKPGGIIVVEVPSRLAPHFLAYQFTGVKWFVRPWDGVIRVHVSYFSPRSMRHLTRLAGFSEQSLVTGRWRAKYQGMLRHIAVITDPVMNAIGVGGILYIGWKS
jgi:SAM-dependent methyltransferase